MIAQEYESMQWWNGYTHWTAKPAIRGSNPVSITKPSCRNRLEGASVVPIQKVRLYIKDKI